MPLPTSAKFFIGGLAGSGLVHLVRPQFYEPIMPPWVPAHREVILGSGVAEIVIAAAMAAPRTRRLASYAAVGLLIGVYPANIQMALDAAKAKDNKMLAGALVRLPFQLPMIRTAWATRNA